MFSTKCRLISANHLLWTKRLRIIGLSTNAVQCLSTTQVGRSVIKVELDDNVEKKLTENELKPRKHAGINKLAAFTIPKRIEKSIIRAVGDYPMKSLIETGEQFNRYLRARKAPTEDANMKQKVKEIEELVVSDLRKYKVPKLPSKDADDIEMRIFNSRKNQAVKQILKQRVYTWQAVNYDEHKSLVYLISRSAEEYATIMRIFYEIRKRDPDFKPQSYFDFGSGVGTGVWAASELWKESIFEYYLVDSSKHMNELSEIILRDGNENKSMTLKNVYFRQFLPARENKYDIVLSAYSMFELPSLRNRVEVANSLWNKASQYLIFIENGTNAGFRVLNEIRDFLFEVKKVTKEDSFIFAPCPHESPCPRVRLDDGTPCNFQVSYNTLPFSGPSTYTKSSYSYLVIKKGSMTADSDRWPRLVRPTLDRHKHVICRMCTQEGKLEEGIFTKAKHGKLTYKICRKSNWGDQLPLKVLEDDDANDMSSDDDEEEEPKDK